MATVEGRECQRELRQVIWICSKVAEMNPHFHGHAAWIRSDKSTSACPADDNNCQNIEMLGNSIK